MHFMHIIFPNDPEIKIRKDVIRFHTTSREGENVSDLKVRTRFFYKKLVYKKLGNMIFGKALQKNVK